MELAFHIYLFLYVFPILAQVNTLVAIQNSINKSLHNGAYEIQMSLYIKKNRSRKGKIILDSRIMTIPSIYVKLFEANK